MSMFTKRILARCRQAMRGEIKLEMLGHWANQLFKMEVPLPPDDFYIVGVLKCRMCGDLRAAAWPIDVLDEDCQECEQCEHMTCEPVAEDCIKIVVAGDRT